MKANAVFLRWWALLVLGLAGCGGGGVTSTPPPPPPPAHEVITITTPPDVLIVQTVPFSVVLQAQGNSSSLTWTVVSAQLPDGLSLDALSGTISGTPTGFGGTQPVIQAADAKGSATKQFNFVVFSKLVINPVTVKNAHLNAPYSLFVNAQGSSGVSSWAISAGQLPPGLALVPQPSPNFISVAGTPTQLGTFSFTIQATDNTVPQTATLDVTLTVDSHVAVTKSSLKTGGQNQVYSDSFTAINGKTPYTWSITGTMPGGLTLNASTGKVSGTPTDFGQFFYTVTVTDSSSPVQTDSVAENILNIAQQLQVVNDLSPAYIGESYNGFFLVGGGSYPYKLTVVSGNLPPGLTMQNNGQVFGTPTMLGSFSFVVQATDSGTPPYVVSLPVTLKVTPTPLNIFSAPLSPAPVNVLYHSQIPESGGTPPYTVAINSGSLPPGLALNASTGAIDGTPTQIGVYNFQIKGTDSSNPPQSATANDFIEIRAPLGRNDSIATATPLGNSQNVQILVPLSISPYIDPVSAATPNPDTDFYRLVANGGSIVHVETFAQRSISLTLDSVIELLDASGNRLHSCTPPAYTASCLNDDLDASTTDSALDFKVPGPASTANTFYAHVLDWRGDARPDMQYYLNVSGVIEPLKIMPATLGPGATRGVNFQQQFTVTGGTGNVTWSLDGGNFPPGWSINAAGLLGGVATTDGFYTFVIKATDASNPPQTARTSYTVQIAEPLVITSPATFPTACANKPYTFQVKTSGGLPPIFFSFSSPSWIAINLDTSTGIFSGTTDVTGTFHGMLGSGDSAQPSSGQVQNVTLTVMNCP
ncbi:MAG: putative Ig domain-containing protein [Candidatus Acidiferrum sp.]